jgi:hypothetical protein
MSLKSILKWNFAIFLYLIIDKKKFFTAITYLLNSFLTFFIEWKFYRKVGYSKSLKILEIRKYFIYFENIKLKINGDEWINFLLKDKSFSPIVLNFKKTQIECRNTGGLVCTFSRILMMVIKNES